jgi:hypothetical protein
LLVSSWLCHEEGFLEGRHILKNVATSTAAGWMALSTNQPYIRHPAAHMSTPHIWSASRFSGVAVPSDDAFRVRVCRQSEKRPPHRDPMIIAMPTARKPAPTAVADHPYTTDKSVGSWTAMAKYVEYNIAVLKVTMPMGG